jgi:hypothetical protein
MTASATPADNTASTTIPLVEVPSAHRADTGCATSDPTSLTRPVLPSRMGFGEMAQPAVSLPVGKTTIRRMSAAKAGSVGNTPKAQSLSPFPNNPPAGTAPGSIHLPGMINLPGPPTMQELPSGDPQPMTDEHRERVVSTLRNAAAACSATADFMMRGGAIQAPALVNADGFTVGELTYSPDHAGGQSPPIKGSGNLHVRMGRAHTPVDAPAAIGAALRRALRTASRRLTGKRVVVMGERPDRQPEATSDDHLLIFGIDGLEGPDAVISDVPALRRWADALWRLADAAADPLGEPMRDAIRKRMQDSAEEAEAMAAIAGIPAFNLLAGYPLSDRRVDPDPAPGIGTPFFGNVRPQPEDRDAYDQGVADLEALVARMDAAPSGPATGAIDCAVCNRMSMNWTIVSPLTLQGFAISDTMEIIRRLQRSEQGA